MTFVIILLQGNITDKFNPFVIDLNINPPQRDITTATNGNDTVEDLSRFPVITVAGTTQTQVVQNQSIVALISEC